MKFIFELFRILAIMLLVLIIGILLFLILLTTTVQAQNGMQYANLIYWCNHAHASDPFCWNVLGEQDHQFTMLFGQFDSGVSIGFPYASGGPTLIYYAAEDDIDLRLHFYGADGRYLCNKEVDLLPSPPGGSALHIVYPCTSKVYQSVLTEVLDGTVSIDAFGKEMPDLNLLYLPVVMK